MLELVNIEMEDEQLRELLSYAVFPDDEVLDNVLEQYRSNPQQRLYQYIEDGEAIGIIGCADDQEMPDALRIRHMAIAPEERGLGYGRGIILLLLEKEKPALLMAETDAEGVEFYRNIGFSVMSTELDEETADSFLCVFHADEEAEEE
ncbi:GNAT family N-acetyltransferase [Paenibacillus sp. WLX2291]|uniref:GNAT family N-acetyltransferase n=1 Tax=Paenibacillus sp. WLX2291 TaxID=3296934 RepID=UPI0039842A41